MLELCDSVTVLRDARAEQILDLGAGSTAPDCPPALELHGVATELGHRDIDLAVRAGEVVGLYGLVGAGRSELARAVIGQHRITAGTVHVDERAVRIRNVAEALERYAIGYVSEDRKQEG